MKRPFKLYWVETPSPEENCFVAARTKKIAEEYEEGGTGFDPGDCKATLVRPLDPSWPEEYCRDKSTISTAEDAFYVYVDDLHHLGIRWRTVEGNDVFEYSGMEYVKQGDINYIASLGDEPRNMVIRSVSDLLEIVARDAVAATGWIFRGHSSCRWPLKAGVHRLSEVHDANLDQIVAYERSLLSEFKRRARIFLQSRPSSDWEWMVLAQHFGLPTRILDWTVNPLIGLFFAVWDAAEVEHDGMLYAYRHGAPAIDIESTSDPFEIKKIELVSPPHLDQRVVAQQSVFTAEPPSLPQGGRNDSDLKYWYVSVNDKEFIRWELQKLGISEGSLFPGLASLAKEIKNDTPLSRFLKQK